MNDLEKQIESEDYVQAGDLASVNILMQKQQVISWLITRAEKFIYEKIAKYLHIIYDQNLEIFR